MADCRIGSASLGHRATVPGDESQGLQLEDSQIASAERLVKLAAVATKAACVDIELTQGRDGTDHMPASNAFTESQIDTLAALGPTLEGSTERQQQHHPV